MTVAGLVPQSHLAECFLRILTHTHASRLWRFIHILSLSFTTVLSGWPSDVRSEISCVVYKRQALTVSAGKTVMA